MDFDACERTGPELPVLVQAHAPWTEGLHTALHRVSSRAGHDDADPCFAPAASERTEARGFPTLGTVCSSDYEGRRLIRPRPAATPRPDSILEPSRGSGVSLGRAQSTGAEWLCSIQFERSSR